MLLDKHIGGWDDKLGYGIDGSLFAKELLELDGMGKKRIQVWINSTGGSVYDGYNICNAILNTKTKVDTYCGGIAASMAGVIFQCGRKRIMADYGILMYHNPYNSDKPDASDNDMLTTMKNSLNKIICQKSGMDEQAVSVMMDRTTFINADEAYEMKLCDEIVSTSSLNTPRLKAANNNLQAYWNEAGAVMNNLLFPNKTRIKMKMVMNRLGLSEDAAEASVLTAIEGIQNKLKAAEAKNQADASAIEALQTQIGEKQTELDELKNQLDALKAEKDALSAEKEAAEKEAKLAEATNMVKGFAAQGRIKNDDATIQSWVNKAVEDMTGVKALMESLPLNRAAVTVGVQNQVPTGAAVTGGEDKRPSAASAAALTAMVQNNLKKKI